MLSTVKNDLKVEFVPGRFIEQPLEIGFRLNDRTSVGESPTLCKSMYVSVDRKRRMPEALAHYDRCCFMSDARQPFQCFEGLGYFTAMFVDQDRG